MPVDNLDHLPPLYHGCLVAFEGPEDIISTQLRLLPACSQILILPSICQYTASDHGQNNPFDAASYIRKVHDSAARRYETALQFLQEATAESKRLVFVCGGTAGAHALCISAISKNETAGDLSQADSVFGSLVKYGVTGLPKSAAARRHRTPKPRNANNEKKQFHEQLGLEDPVFRAMKAADALYKETAGLQPSVEFDLSANGGHRSTGLGVTGMLDASQGSRSSYPPFIEPDRNDNEDLVADTETDAMIQRRAALTSRFSPSSDGRAGHQLSIHVPHRSCSSGGGAHESVFPSPSIFSEVPCSLPPSPVPVVYGEARLVQVRHADIGNPFRPSELTGSSEPTAEAPARSTEPDYSWPKHRYLEVPKATLLDKSEVAHTQPYATLGRVPPEQYVDRGVDADEHAPDTVGKCDLERSASFVPVLPLSEDLIIYFTEKRLDAALDFVIQRFKEGFYPILRPPSLEPLDDEEDMRSTHSPTDPAVVAVEAEAHASVHAGALRRAPEEAPPTQYYQDEYDPFAYNAGDVYRSGSWSSGKSDVARPSLPPRLPSPLPTSSSPPGSSPPSRNHLAEKMHSFALIHGQPAVSVQDSLRRLLGVYFPAKDQGYHRPRLPLSVDSDNLWNPMFYDPELSDSEPGHGKMDMILAVGAQSGVGKEPLFKIISQMERLAAKPKGPSRGGRADLRYLITIAMQAFWSRPLVFQDSDDPFANPDLLATLILPHLETYLASHIHIRFLLLEYPPEHLSTVLALQSLVGNDILKVSAVVNGSHPEPARPQQLGADTNNRGIVSDWPKFTSVPQRSLDHPEPPFLPANPAPHFPQVDFVIIATASDSEIAIFISTVWRTLIRISDFYVPEHSPRRTVRRTPHATVSAYPLEANRYPGSLRKAVSQQDVAASQQHMLFQATPTAFSPPLPPTRTEACSPPPAPVMSASDAVRSCKTAQSGNEKLRVPRPSRTGDGSTSSCWGDGAYDHMQGLEEDEEGDLNMEERRLVPMLVGKDANKGGSRKALKWLGLA